jgi:Flp pilus assembly protein TadG
MSTPQVGAATPLPWQFLPDYEDLPPREQLRRIQENFDAQSVAVGSAGATSTGTVTLQNSWVDVGGAYAPTKLYKRGDGTVLLEGVITKAASVYAAEVLLNVPVGYRPAAGQVFLTAQTSSTPTYGSARLELSTIGDLTLVAGSLGAVTIGQLSVCGLVWKAAG